MFRYKTTFQQDNSLAFTYTIRIIQGRSQDLAGGGGKNYFFQIWKFACARGVRRHAPPRKFFKMVQFGAFWCIFRSDFVFKKFQKLPFFI